VTEAGSATPGSNTNPTTGGESPPSEGSSGPSSNIPAPPRDLSLDGIDPCTLFTETQLADLQINDVRPNDGSSAGTIYEGMSECTLDKDAAEPFVSYDVVAVTNVDVSFWINERRNAEAKLVSIGGYPAAEFHIPGSKYDCAVALGVAKNQHLHVEMTPISGGITGDDICQGSKQAAEMALQTLQTMR
jgi:hypothetical protein